MPPATGRLFSTATVAAVVSAGYRDDMALVAQVCSALQPKLALLKQKELANSMWGLATLLAGSDVDVASVVSGEDEGDEGRGGGLAFVCMYLCRLRGVVSGEDEGEEGKGDLVPVLSCFCVLRLQYDHVGLVLIF